MPPKMPDWKYIKYDIQERLEHLFLRRWINSNPRIVIAITNLSVIILIIVIIGMFRPDETVKVSDPKKEWYYDLNTGQLFVAKASLTPPVVAPSGPLPNSRPAGVRAYIFSYVPDPNDSQRFIGFLETKDPNYIDDDKDHPKWRQGMLIKRVDDKEWFPADSRQGRAIFQKALTPNENGENPYYCHPK